MKNIIKKMISFLLVLLLVFSITPVGVASAHTKNDIDSIASNFLNIVLESPNDYGLNDISDDFQLSEAITPLKYNDNGELEKMADIEYYFIYSNNKPVATLIANDNVSSVMFETDTAKELEAFNNDSFTVICDKDGAHINSTVYDVKSLIKLSSIDLSNDDLLEGTVQGVNSDGSLLRTPVSYGLSIPIVQQYNDNNCWAACVASAGKYFTGISKTARDVCDEVGIEYNEGANSYQIAGALNIYDLNGYVAGGYYEYIADIYDLLSSDIVPLAIFGSNLWDDNPKNDYGHNVIIQGYQVSTQGAFLRIMDPNYSSYCIIFNGNTPSGQSSWTFTYGTDVFYWVETVLASQ